ncbi:MAG: hypothetical protein WC812_04810 [Candidatus Pacearchaeota archaeon]|jgi:hypothetical protein
MVDKKIKMDNIHFMNEMIPYSYLETLCWGLNEIASMSPINPTEKIKNKYPNISAESRTIYVKVIPNEILYLVEEKATPRGKLECPINCRGYVLDLREGKELLSVLKLERLVKIMDIQIGSDLID